MPENNLLQKPLTLEDLGKFTEEILLPAIGTIIEEKLGKLEIKLDAKLEEKLSPIRSELSSIRVEISSIR